MNEKDSDSFHLLKICVYLCSSVVENGFIFFISCLFVSNFLTLRDISRSIL